MAIINGDSTDEFLMGDQEDDLVIGAGGNDTLLGGGGNDTLNGGPGDDFLLGDPGNEVFQYSFTLSQSAGEAQPVTFTDWLSEKYGKDFGDELPDFERGHHHHDHDHGKHHHHHGKHHHHAKHDHHHKHDGCDDHQPSQWGLSQDFFSKNYGQWLKEVVVADLLAQGLVHDANGNGKIDVKFNANDPDGTPWIEGLSDELLNSIFGDRDEVTLRHGHHGHDKWYSNSYTSPGGDGGETTVSSADGSDTIANFDFDDSLGLGFDKIQFNFTADLNWDAGFADNAEKLAFLESFFEITQVDAFNTPDPNDVNSTRISLSDHTWSTTLEATLLDTPEVLSALDIYVNDVLIG